MTEPKNKPFNQSINQSINKSTNQLITHKWPKNGFFSLFSAGGGGAGTLETNRRALKLKV